MFQSGHPIRTTTMINGAHIIMSSTDPDADRAFRRDVLEFPHVDVGHGWLIFGRPPSEVAVHPAESGGGHELFFMCEDFKVFVAAIRQRNIDGAEIEDQGWGLLTRFQLPGGGDIGVHEPKHERPASAVWPRVSIRRRTPIA